jgi:hypothetical protein
MLEPNREIWRHSQKKNCRNLATRKQTLPKKRKKKKRKANSLNLVPKKKGWVPEMVFTVLKTQFTIIIENIMSFV